MNVGEASRTCVILAGGLGTRLRSAVNDRPKALAPVGNRTFLALLLEHVAAHGITDVVLVLGYRAEQVVAAISQQPLPLPVRHVIEPEPLGTGGAVAYCMDRLMLDEVLVANGDTWLEGEIAAMFVSLDLSAGELFRMATVDVPDRGRFGGVTVGLDGRVEGFLEKGVDGPGRINAGFYRLCRAALPARRVGAWSLETDVLPSLVARRHVTATLIEGSFIDIGVPSDYQRFCEDHAR